ncbi:MAG: hypothetical protein R3Y32_02045 [Bacillota bacterium]
MITKLVGKKLDKAVEMLSCEGIEFEIVAYNDKKMKSFDETLVLRATKKGEKIILVATNFLFAPETEACKSINEA